MYTLLVLRIGIGVAPNGPNRSAPYYQFSCLWTEGDAIAGEPGRTHLGFGESPFLVQPKSGSNPAAETPTHKSNESQIKHVKGNNFIFTSPWIPYRGFDPGPRATPTSYYYLSADSQGELCLRSRNWGILNRNSLADPGGLGTSRRRQSRP